MSVASKTVRPSIVSQASGPLGDTERINPSATRIPDDRIPPHPPSDFEELTVTRLFGAIRRQLAIMAVVVCVSLAMGFLGYLATPNTYIAEATLLVDDRLSQLADRLDAAPTFVRDETSFFNEVAVLNSRELALQVVRDLDLLSDSAMQNPPALGLGKVKSLISSAIGYLLSEDSQTTSFGDDSQLLEQLETKAADSLRETLRVQQQGRGFTIKISFESHDPQLATRVLRSYLTAYMGAPARASEAATNEALAWLEQRQELLQKALTNIDKQIRERRLDSVATSSAEIDTLLRRRAAIEKIQASSTETYVNLLNSQESVPISGVKLLDAPQDLDEPSAPSLFKWIILSGLLGSVFAVLVAAVREAIDDNVYTAEQLSGTFGAPFLGYLPNIKHLTDVFVPGSRLAKKPENRSAFLYEESLIEALSLIESKLTGNLQCHIVGLTSMTDGDGKSTIAANLAELAALHGKRVLIVDGDRYGEGLTNLLADKMVLANETGRTNSSIKGSVLARLEGSNLYALTYERLEQTSIPAPHFNNYRLDEIESILSRFDLVIIDLPSLAVSNEARLNAGRFDTLVFVTVWGNTKRKLISKYMKLNPNFANEIDGYFINKTNLKKLRTYPGGELEATVAKV